MQMKCRVGTGTFPSCTENVIQVTQVSSAARSRAEPAEHESRLEEKDRDEAVSFQVVSRCVLERPRRGRASDPSCRCHLAGKGEVVLDFETLVVDVVAHGMGERFGLSREDDVNVVGGGSYPDGLTSEALGAPPDANVMALGIGVVLLLEDQGGLPAINHQRRDGALDKRVVPGKRKKGLRFRGSTGDEPGLDWPPLRGRESRRESTPGRCFEQGRSKSRRQPHQLANSCSTLDPGDGRRGASQRGSRRERIPIVT